MGEVNAEMQSLLGTLKAEGHIDDQFQQLLMLQDESDPDFVSSVMQLFFEDSQTSLQRIHDMLRQSPVDYTAVDSAVHQLKGSSASFGAHHFTSLCMQLRQAVQQHQADTALQIVEQLGEARRQLQDRLQQFVKLDAQQKQHAAQS